MPRWRSGPRCEVAWPSRSVAAATVAAGALRAPRRGGVAARPRSPGSGEPEVRCLAIEPARQRLPASPARRSAGVWMAPTAGSSRPAGGLLQRPPERREDAVRAAGGGEHGLWLGQQQAGLQPEATAVALERGGDGLVTSVAERGDVSGRQDDGRRRSRGPASARHPPGDRSARAGRCRAPAARRRARPATAAGTTCVPARTSDPSRSRSSSTKSGITERALATAMLRAGWSVTRRSRRNQTMAVSTDSSNLLLRSLPCAGGRRHSSEPPQTLYRWLTSRA